ncbi:MAG: phosphodiesterase [Naasia sp.]|uniref:phosphodiesterase n=1 Tax=Naasia sp. TaxID=2546198 RepID=UPI002635357E|nr:phosphodiesterase [Naasia sp.]MCU1571131.1 phosphodiesterase [Naasia sp.]
MPIDSPPTHVIAHLSDTHLLAGGEPLHGVVDTVSLLQQAMRRLEDSQMRLDAIVHSGDIADRGELDAYLRVREIMEPAAERLGCPIVWVAGNHDSRGPLREGLLGEEPTTSPLDSVIEVNGLRIVALDTSVPDQGHGDVDDEQLTWLRRVLSQPAPHGTILTLHHPPLPTTVRVLDPFQLRSADALAAAVEGSDVRAILSGHLHYSLNGTLAGVPVSVVPATSYTIRIDAPHLGLTGVNGSQSIALAVVYPERVVHVLLPLADSPAVVTLPDGFFE